MAALYGSLKGARGMATRIGRDTMRCHVRGWDLGVAVEAFHDQNGDHFDLYITRGSNNPSNVTRIGSVYNGEFIPCVEQK